MCLALLGLRACPTSSRSARLHVLDRRIRVQDRLREGEVERDDAIATLGPEAWPDPPEDFLALLGPSGARPLHSVLRDQREGSLVLVGSLIGHIAVPDMAAYVLSKWGVRALVRDERET